MEPSRSTFWRRRARRTALRYNLGCLLGHFLPASLGLSALFACALLIVRERGPIGAGVWTAYGVGLLACLLFAWARARRGFFTLPDALARLDWQMGLHNRLSAAAAGVGAFPVPRAVADGYAFRWRRIVPPLAAAVALVWTAACLPLSKHAAVFVPAVPPAAWTQAAHWIDNLQKSGLLQEPALAEARERLEQLQRQPARDWYSQSSLEAGDSLRDQTAQSIDALQHDLRSTLGNLDAMQKFTDQTSAAEIKSTGENLDYALKGLELGNLPLNQDLLKQLKEADLGNLKTLTPEQMDELKRRLKEGAQVCEACLQPGDAKGDPKGVVLVAAPPIKDGKIVRGGSTQPLSLNEKPTDLGTSARDALSNPDLSHALPGDTVGVGKGEHTVDPAKYTGPAAGGTITSPGTGGETVWRDDLTPSERGVLKNFFK